MFKRHSSYEEKLLIVSQKKKGMRYSALSKLYGIDRKMLREWVSKFDLYGESGLRNGTYIKATASFKEEVVRFALNKVVSLPEVALHFGISISVLRSWIRIVREQGYDALQHSVKSGRPPKTMRRPKKHQPETELEKLQAENIRLRAEVALLKKVQALVKEREARERKNGWKPSKN